MLEDNASTYDPHEQTRRTAPWDSNQSAPYPYTWLICKSVRNISIHYPAAAEDSAAAAAINYRQADTARA